jgi:8-oxo-dGTP pyrophosphatase MutT (NUDIX family)
MTIYGVRRRVACYVTRTGPNGAELLVFEHADDNPADPSGVQIPAGGMLPFEAIDQAAQREVEEESGLTNVTFQRQLGSVELGLNDEGGPSVTTFVHLTVASGGPPSWTHTVTGQGDDNALTCDWRWEPYPPSFELAAGQGVYLDWLAPA